MERLPELPLAEWRATEDTLHLWVQIVGKVRMAASAPRNHWWHVPLYVGVRGLTTGRLRTPDGLGFEIRFDFVDHRLVIETSDGGAESFPLVEGLSVAEFDRELHGALGRLGVDVAIREAPFGMPITTPFPDDQEHASYDQEAVERYWRAVEWTDEVFQEFSGWYCGKTSPVHLFWHSFDLAFTRFGGRRAPERPDADPVTREAYTHEVVSFGFWPGDDNVDEPSYYSYTAPEPPGLRERAIEPDEAFWAEQGGGSLAIAPLRGGPDGGRPEGDAAGVPGERLPGGRRRRRLGRRRPRVVVVPEHAGAEQAAVVAPRAMSRRQRLTLVAAILGSGVATIDGTIVNVALPAIERDLGGGLPGQQWVSNAYLLTLASLILIGGSLGDIYGERRIFAIGVSAFGVLSVVCALSPTIGVLIAARTLQGAAGALVTPSSLAIIVAAFSPAERGAAIGSWTAWGGIAAIVGPLAGGWIVDQVSWRWIFALNVPLVAVTLLLILSAVPRTARVTGRRVDVLGAALCVAGLAGFVFALIEQPRYGWTSPLILVPLIGGVTSLGAFFAYERRAPQPMLKLDLFARRNFAIGNLETLTMYAGLSILFFFLVIFLQQVAGYSALRSGLVTLPTTLVMFALSRRVGALADRYGPRLFMGAGPLIAAAGILLLLRTDTHTSALGDLLPALLVFSVGLSMTVAPLTAAVLADADETDAGIASAINNAIARVAGLVGVSVIGVVVAGTLTGDTFGPDHQSVKAFHEAILICAVLVAAGGVAGAIGIVNPRRTVKAESCPGGQLAGVPEPAAGA